MRGTLSTALLIVALCFGLTERSAAQPGQIYSYTIATEVGQYPYGDGGPATAALLALPRKIAIDSKGAIYIADAANHKVRKIVSGQITTLAGTGVRGFSGDGSAAVNAQLTGPSGLAIDSAGNVYIYDTGNEVIRKVDANGIISTFAGTPGVSGSGGDGGPATQAKLSLNPVGGLAVDSTGDVYISDTRNSVVRKVTVSTGIISTIAGVIGQPGNSGDGGQATAARLNFPAGLAFDPKEHLFIADAHNRNIRRLAHNGTISTVAGTGQKGATGDGGPAAAATFNLPQDIAFDPQGNLYIADTTNNKIRMVSLATLNISTLAGSGAPGYSGDGGPATAAQLDTPTGVAVDSSGTVYIVDSFNNRVRTVRAGTINEFAGADHAQGDGGKATAALLYFPQSFAWDATGNLYIADTQNNKIRKVTPDGKISTVAGTGAFQDSGDGGPAIAAGVNQPEAVVVDSSGNLLISTFSQVRKVDRQGNISTVAGSAATQDFTGDGGPATAATLNFPIGMALDAAGNLYIADTNNHRIRKVSGGIISTVAGSGPVCGFPCNDGSFSGDGGPATSANLNYPFDVAFDGSGNMLIADTFNNRIRQVDAKGNISTLAGSSTTGGYAGDLGPATSALLSLPSGVRTDSAGNLYFTDAANFVVRVVDLFGVISTIAGNGKPGFSGDGGPAISAELNNPEGIAVDASGKVWFADTNNHRIRQLTPAGPLVPSAKSVVNAASFLPGGLVPGGMATLFGSNLTSATGINLAGSIPLATELLNSAVKFNNKTSAPIFAVDNVNGQQQINFQVPWELAGQNSAILQVVNNGALSPPVKVPVLTAQPGVFAYYVGQSAFAVVLHANFQLADSGHPVTAGETVLIYCTNLGAVSPAIQDGAAGTGKELTVAQPTATIGGVSAPVAFSGLAPDFVGLYQVNVVVPTGLTSGNQLLVLTIIGASSQPVLLPVK
jgi:uncharacterized protein (TIGR03437 family)